MKPPKFWFYLIFPVLLVFNLDSFSQSTVIKGKVTDAETGDPISFGTVGFEGTAIAVYTNDAGEYKIETQVPKDSLSFSFYGYTTVKRPVTPGVEQQINVKMTPLATAMKDIVLTTQEDPAYGVLRKVIKNKEKYDKRNFESYEYESFTTIVGSFDKIPKAIRDKKVGTDIASVLDSLKDEEGKSVGLPFFASEAVSRYYFRKNPEKSTEKIIGTKVTGVFIQDGSLVSQIIGASFQNYNFYQNWMTVVEKDFISPIADGGFAFYEYTMWDTISYLGKTLYEIKVSPKREQDLAFTGKIWIEDSTFALRKVKVEVGKGANINYVNEIKIEQELVPTSAGPWLPEYSEVYIKLSPVSEKWTGLESNFKSYNSDFVVNSPKPLKFYEDPIVVEEEAAQRNIEFWEQKRVEPLTEEEKRIYAIIDTVKNIPRVKTYVEVIDVAINGFYKTKYIDFGQYMTFFAYNDIEGPRFSLGARTNKNFSQKWTFRGSSAYGIKDNQFKYYGQAGYIVSRKDWTKITASFKYDIDQIAIPEDKLEENNNLFLAFTKWGTLRGPTYNTTADLSFFRQFTKDFSQRITFRNRFYNPVFPFAYFERNTPGSIIINENLTTSEIILETRLARDELFVINDNERISLGTKSWPVLKLKVGLGLKDVLGSQFNYQKVDVTLSDNFKVGVLGRSYYDLSYGKIFGTVPVLLQEVHLGNRTPFYTTAGYNLMDYFEFVSDEYLTLKYRHYFQGLFFNRIPLIKKLNWRFLTTANVLFGGLSDKNRELNAPYDRFGNTTLQLYALKNVPYVELGYGIENIFKILRVDAFHRITYLDKPSARKFGIKISFQFSL